MKKYHLWTEGCQMNVADSQRVGSSLEHLGYTFTEKAEEADVIVLNTCVVRQSAEDKALGRLTSLRPLKQKNPNLVINLMGCMVGVRGAEKLRAKLPFVDVFSPPSDPGPLISFLSQGEVRAIEVDETARCFGFMDGDLILPEHERGKLISAHVPIVYGCSHACTFCIIPYQRGVERSRPVNDIVSEIRSLVAQGVKEITLLGQIVDRYGKDVPDSPNLAALLRLVHEIEGIERIRFLTSHPNYFTEDLMDAVTAHPKVMPHIEYAPRLYPAGLPRPRGKNPRADSRLLHRDGHHRWLPRRDRGAVHGNLSRPFRSSAGCGPSGALLIPRGYRRHAHDDR
jgi:tRNA-2-methylthio-N6-dimethylallyladenosine synthase